MNKTQKADVRLEKLVEKFKSGLGDLESNSKGSIESAHAQIVITDSIKVDNAEKVLNSISKINDNFEVTGEKEGEFKTNSEHFSFLVFGKTEAINLRFDALLCSDHTEEDAFNLGKECAEEFHSAQASVNQANNS